MSFKWFALLLYAFGCGSLHAADDYDVNLTIEDDYGAMSFGGDDRAYTAGWRFSYVKAIERLPGWVEPLLDWLADSKTAFNYGLALGQQTYTPEQISNPYLITNDEPYAGYLFAGLSFQLRNDTVLHSFELDLGIVGPPSLAGEVQQTFHRIFGFYPVRGWEHQLHTEPTLTLFYQQRRRLFAWRTSDGTPWADVVPSFEGALGNLYLYAGTGVQLRAGWGMSDAFGPTVLTPMGVDPFVESYPTGAVRPSVEVYGFAAAEGRFMVRNLFLDGNTFQASNHIDKERFVFDLDYGVALRIDSFRASWRQIVRSREFIPESEAHPFASIALSYSRRF